MRKILRQKFWSHGTSLGYLRPGSQGDLGLGFCGPQFLLVWGPYKPPALVAPQGTAKNLKPTAAWCDNYCFSQNEPDLVFGLSLKPKQSDLFTFMPESCEYEFFLIIFHISAH